MIDSSPKKRIWPQHYFLVQVQRSVAIKKVYQKYLGKKILIFSA